MMLARRHVGGAPAGQPHAAAAAATLAGGVVASRSRPSLAANDDVAAVQPACGCHTPAAPLPGCCRGMPSHTTACTRPAEATPSAAGTHTLSAARWLVLSSRRTDGDRGAAAAVDGGGELLADAGPLPSSAPILLAAGPRLSDNARALGRLLASWAVWRLGSEVPRRVFFRCVAWPEQYASCMVVRELKSR